MNWPRGLLRTSISIGGLGLVFILLSAVYKSVSLSYVLLVVSFHRGFFIIATVVMLATMLFFLGWALLWVVRGFKRD